MSRMAVFPHVDEFYIESEFDNPDEVTVGLVVVDDAGKKGVVKVTFAGDITYPAKPSDGPDHGDLTMPLAEDFLTQFAASMGYSVIKS